MKIELDQPFLGDVTIRQVRDFMRRVGGDGSLSLTWLGDHFDNPEAVLAELLRRGWVEPEETPGCYGLTTDGSTIRLSRALPRIARAKADAIVAKLRERIAELNADPEPTFYVREARLFGSYITGAQELGDIDVAIDIPRRPEYETAEGRKRSIALCMERARASGRNVNHIEAIFFDQYEMYRVLRRVSRYISLHGIDDLRNLKIEGRPLWPPIELAPERK